MDWFIFVLGVVVTSLVIIAVLLIAKMEDRMRAADANLHPTGKRDEYAFTDAK